MLIILPSVYFSVCVCVSGGARSGHPCVGHPDAQVFISAEGSTSAWRLRSRVHRSHLIHHTITSDKKILIFQFKLADNFSIALKH